MSHRDSFIKRKTDLKKPLDLFDLAMVAMAGGSSFEGGDGSDGALTVSSNSTITGHKQYTTLTVDAGVTLQVGSTGGQSTSIIFADTEIIINGTISSVQTGRGYGGGGTGYGGGGGAGGAGGIGAERQQQNDPATPYQPGFSGQAGFNGQNQSNINGLASAVSPDLDVTGWDSDARWGDVTNPTTLQTQWTRYGNYSASASGGDGGRGGTGGSASNNQKGGDGGTGGTGGSGGGGSGAMWLIAPTITFGSSGLIDASGGDALNGSTGSPGSPGVSGGQPGSSGQTGSWGYGGNGAFLAIRYETLTGYTSAKVDVAGGIGKPNQSSSAGNNGYFVNSQA